VRVVSVVTQPVPGATVGVDLATGAWEVLADLQGREQARLEETASAAAARLEDRGLSVSVDLRHGDPAHEILAAADAWEADLILLGSRGRSGLERFLLGSVAQNVAKHARRPVLVVRKPGAALQRVLVALDGSEHSRHALELAARLPLPAETGCVAVHVVRPYAPFPGLLPTDRPEFDAAVRAVNEQRHQEAEALTAEAVSQLTGKGRHARAQVLEGDPAERLLELAEADEADLIIAGARGVSAIQGLLVGSVADRLLKNAPCSVLLVH
jgi:nucleotide-binding universal stress UspA family protein